MQETVTNTNERETLFSVFLDILESRDKIAQADSELQHEKYQRRTQRIYDYQARQQREATELRRRLDYVSQHAHVLESVLCGAAGEGAPLAYALVRQAAALQRCIAQCVANAARIRRLLSAAHRPQMDAVLAKMEAELSTWTAFLQRAADSSWNSEALYDNLLNMIAEQQRCVREVSASPVVVSMCGAGAGEGEGEREGEARDTDESAGEVTLRTPAPGRAPPAPLSPLSPRSAASSVAPTCCRVDDPENFNLIPPTLPNQV